MPHFEHYFTVQASIDQVACFHNDSRALKLLTPPPVIVQMHYVEPLDEGSVADFTMWLGPIPVRWTAVHQNVDLQHGFTDVQRRGPFNQWVHRHSFHRLDAHTTQVVDQVDAEFGQHWFWGLISRLMWFGLKGLFAYRAWATKRSLQYGCKSPASAWQSQ